MKVLTILRHVWPCLALSCLPLLGMAGGATDPDHGRPGPVGFQSQTGTTGLVTIPSGHFLSDRTFLFSMNTVPKKYHLIAFKKGIPTGQKVYTLDALFLPFVEVAFTVIRPDNIKTYPWGIGDRSVKGRLLVFREKKYRPSLVAGMHDVFSANFYQSTAYLVSSKSWTLAPALWLDLTLGYGFDVTKKPWSKTPFFSNEDRQVENLWLKGTFGGFAIQWRTSRLAFDYDTQKVNAALDLLFWNSLGLKITTLAFDRMSYGLALRTTIGKRHFAKKF